MRTRPGRRAVAILGGLGLLLVAVAGPGPVDAATGAPSSVATNSTLADSTVGASPFSAHKTVTRTYLKSDGSEQVVSSKTVHVKVSQTKDLYGRQSVNVRWSGASPTQGVQPYLNRANADQQEYPMVLLECRGRDNASLPAAQQVSPQTCWTHGADQRYQGLSYTAFGPWRLDRYAAPADRAAVVGRPANVTAACGYAATTEHWLPFRAVNGTNYYYGNQSCAGIPPEDYNSDQSAQVVPQNTTFAPTGLDGTGSWKFDVWTEAENASLGCSAATACTLEVIPISGISCDPYGKSAGVPRGDVPGPDDVERAKDLCETTGNYQPGQQANASTGAALAVSGALWWSASNWRNRIPVPLSFAPVSNACSQTGGGAPVSVYGSELMAEATTQWAPKFCLDPKLFKLTHVQTAEPLAQSLLNTPGSGVQAAFGSQPPQAGFSRPTVQSPVALSGFSISYTIDNDRGDAVGTLRMTPRLLAKLITESYTGEDFDRFGTGQYPYLGHNPYNITDDPEFQALNPGISSEFGNAGPATLIMLSAESDVTWALTSYINSDPEARAWLDGKPDPWGMVVNKNYKGISLPVLRWPLLDTTQPNFGQDVPCTALDPAPWLPLVASPTPTLATTSLDVQFATSPGKVACTTIGDPGAGQLVQWTSEGSQPPGQRFVIGVTSLGEAARYDLSTAELQTASTVPATQQYTDGAGRTFVSADTASLLAASKHLNADKTNKVWTVPAAALRSDPAAYPGLMIVDADVPTSGLTHDEANDYANLLDFAADAGQVVGTGNGQLPAGYLPMTRANGLGALASYTQRAADAVRAQSGTVPSLDPPPATHARSGGTTHQSSGGSGGTAPTGGAAAPNGSGGQPAGHATSKAAVPSGSQRPTPGAESEPPAAASVTTPGTGLGASGVLLPIVLGIAALGGLAAGAATYRGRRSS